ISLGIFLIPLIPYYYKLFSRIFKKTSALSTFFLTCASIGCILIGLIPNYPEIVNIHSVNAVLIFLGFNMFGILSVAIILADTIINKEKRGILKNKQLAIFYVISVVYLFACTLLTLTFVIGSAGEQYVFKPGTPLLLRPPFWEWQTFVMILVSTSLLFILTPEQVKPIKN
ncbi:MAG: hypothetical protein ACFFCS_29120, partial [Candidatus Hodarchaeota archaeon]